mgnify:FL=1
MKYTRLSHVYEISGAGAVFSRIDWERRMRIITTQSIIAADIITMPIMPIMAKRTAKMDTAITVSIVSRRAVFIAAALPAQEEDAQQDSLQRVHEPVMLKLFSKRAVMSASPFVMMAAL